MRPLRLLRSRAAIFFPIVALVFLSGAGLYFLTTRVILGGEELPLPDPDELDIDLELKCADNSRFIFYAEKVSVNLPSLGANSSTPVEFFASSLPSYCEGPSPNGTTKAGFTLLSADGRARMTWMMLFQRNYNNDSTAYWQSAEMVIYFEHNGQTTRANWDNAMQALNWVPIRPLDIPSRGLRCPKVTVPIDKASTMQLDLLELMPRAEPDRVRMADVGEC